MRYSNSFYVDLLYVQNIYQRTLNLEIIYHVAWVMLIKSTLFVEAAVIKNTHINQNNHKKCQKVKNLENVMLWIKTVVAFRKVGKELEGIQNVTRCLNIFSVGDPSYHSIN